VNRDKLAQFLRTEPWFVPGFVICFPAAIAPPDNFALGIMPYITASIILQLAAVL